MIDNLNKINEATSNEVIIVGGYARWLNGDIEKPTKKWIDIAIDENQVENVKSLGTYLQLPHTNEQFVVNCGDYILDVFIQDISDLDYTIISDLKVITKQADLDYHTMLSASLQTDYAHQKLESIKAIYS